MKKTLITLLLALAGFTATAQPPPFTQLSTIPYVNQPNPAQTGPLVLTRAGVLSVPVAAAPLGAEIYSSLDLKTWVYVNRLAAGATMNVTFTEQKKFYKARVIAPLVVTITGTSGTLVGTSTKTLGSMSVSVAGQVRTGWQVRTHLDATGRISHTEWRFPNLPAGLATVTFTDEDNLVSVKTAEVTSASPPTTYAAFNPPAPGEWAVNDHQYQHDYYMDRTDHTTIIIGNRGQLDPVDSTLEFTTIHRDGNLVLKECHATYGGPGSFVNLETQSGPCFNPSWRLYPANSEYARYRDGGQFDDLTITDELFRSSNSAAWATIDGAVDGIVRRYLIKITVAKVTARSSSEVEFSYAPSDVVKRIGGSPVVQWEGPTAIAVLYTVRGGTFDVTPTFDFSTSGWYIYFVDWQETF